jgi:hypothetical protein
MVQLVDSADINIGLIIDRKRFHDAIKLEILDYIKKLKDPAIPKDHILRDNFIKKMEYITKQ